jgi:hypothetical protein
VYQRIYYSCLTVVLIAGLMDMVYLIYPFINVPPDDDTFFEITCAYKIAVALMVAGAVLLIIRELSDRSKGASKKEIAFFIVAILPSASILLFEKLIDVVAIASFFGLIQW